MERLSTEVTFKGTVVSSHFRLLGEKMTKCISMSSAHQCFMGVMEEADLEGAEGPDDVETKVTYFCDPSQRKECGDLIVEAAVELENTRR